MTTYNTGNPIGSTEVKDLYDNAQNFDTLSTTTTLETVPDRLGVPRMSLHGFEEEAKRRFESIKFQPPIPYAPGIEVTTSSLTVDYLGVLYYALPSALPFTTGAWNPEQWSPLQNTNPGNELLVFDDYAAASAAAATLPDGQRVEIASDENKDGHRSRYVIQSGALIFEANLDQLKVDLSEAQGASLVGFSSGGAGAVTTSVENALRKTILDSNYEAISQALSVAQVADSQVFITKDTTILVPSDASTLQEAFDRTKSNGKSTITVKIESGHALTHGLKLENGDWSNYRIEATDPVTYLATGFVGVGVESTMPNSLIVGNNARMPLLACLIQADDKCQAGYMCYNESEGRVAKDCGVTYAGSFGLYVLNGSSCHAPASNFSYAGLGNRVTTNSKLEAEGADFSNTQNRGFPDPNNDRCALDVSRGSIVNIKSQGANVTNLSGSAGNGLSVRRSLVSAEGINASGCALTALRVEAAAVVSAGSSNLSGAGSYGVLAANAATVDVQGSNITGCTDYAISATRASRVSANGADCQNTVGVGRGIYATDGAEIDASQTNTTGALAAGYFATYGGKINARASICDMTGSSASSYAVFADYGAEISCAGGQFSNSTSGQDIRCTRGSTIRATGATGTPSKTVNTLDVNGVIFR